MSALAGNLLSLLTLAGVALVMNINNSIAVGALTSRAGNRRDGFRIRLGGLLLSLVLRLLLVMVFGASLRPEFSGLMGLGVSVGLQRSLCLVAGLFLIASAGMDMKRRLSVARTTRNRRASGARALGLVSGMFMVAAVDVSVSFDSLIAVAGMAAHPAIMPVVVTLEVVVVLLFAETISMALKRHPTIETLAICALLLMGGVMMLRSAGYELPDAAVYAMIGFALLVELLDMRIAAVEKSAHKEE